jgi:farnesol dehydrogenase
VFARTAAAPDGIAGDIRDTRAVTAAAAGMDAIVHTAALVAVWRKDPAEFDAVNVGGLQSVLAAARANGVPRIVYTSSFLALPPANTPQPLTANHYQRTKVAARDVARRAAADGLPVVTLYPGVVYGPGPATEGNLVGRLMHDQLRGKLPVIIGPEHTWSFAFVDDVADAHVAAVTHASPAREYAVGGVNAPQGSIYAFVRDRRHRAIPPRIPYGLATAGAAACEALAAITGRAPLLTRGVVEIFRHDWPLDSAGAQRDLGLRVTPLTDGLERTLAALP